MEQNPFDEKPKENKDSSDGSPHESIHSEQTTSFKSQLAEFFAHGKWADPRVNKLLEEWKDSFMQKMYEMNENLSDKEIHKLFIDEQIKMLKEAKENNEVPSGKQYLQDLIEELSQES